MFRVISYYIYLKKNKDVLILLNSLTRNGRGRVLFGNFVRQITYPNKNMMKRFTYWALVAILVCNVSLFTACSSSDDTPASGEIAKHYSVTVQHLITALDANPEVKQLVEKSIAAAKQINPDKTTNPAQTLDEYYDFLDWTLTRMPWDYFPEHLFKGFAEKTDQSILYPYWILDQPLDELKDKGLFFNSVEYVSPVKEWLIEYCRAWAVFLDTPASWNDSFYEMIRSEESFGLDKGWYEDPSNWHSFNDFFSRRLSSPAARPVASPDDDHVVCAPADALPQGVWDISADGQFHADAIVSEEGVTLKSATFVTVEQLLGPDGAAYAPLFHEGTLTHTYLNYDDYHRFHFPVGGTVKSMYIIPHDDSVGGIVYWSDKLKRYVLESNSLSWQAYETRGCAIVETEEYGLVAVLPIGMGQVSSVNWEPDLKVGQKVEKGAPLGYFLFGGSDCVLLFQKQAGFKHTAPRGGEGSYSNGYAHIYQGEQLGTIGK